MAGTPIRRLMNFIRGPQISEGSAPGTPGSGIIELYGKSDHHLYSKGSDGVEIPLGGREVIIVALGDETTAITTGTAKVTMRMPFAMTLTSVKASLTTASSSGIPTFNVKESGTTIFTTKVTIDASELTSATAATAAVLSDTSLADDAEITFDIDVAGTGAKGAKIYLIGYRT